MMVVCDPGTPGEYRAYLDEIMRPSVTPGCGYAERLADKTATAFGLLVEVLVARGVIELSDCGMIRSGEAPWMEHLKETDG